jgi:hypothetical protein
MLPVIEAFMTDRERRASPATRRGRRALDGAKSGDSNAAPPGGLRG